MKTFGSIISNLLKSHSPEQFKGVELEDFLRAINAFKAITYSN